MEETQNKIIIIYEYHFTVDKQFSVSLDNSPTRKPLSLPCSSLPSWEEKDLELKLSPLDRKFILEAIGKRFIYVFTHFLKNR